MPGWRTPDEDPPDEEAPDEEVHRRFVRVVGLPPVEDDEPPVTGPVPAPVPASDAASGPASVPTSPPVTAWAAVDPRRHGVRALALVAVVVVAIAASVAWWSRPRVEPVRPVADRSGVPAAGPVAGSESPAVIVVAVAGRVVRPGLVRLPSGSRVADAIEAAGGVLPGTDLSYVNLARKLVDGELIVIGVTPPPEAAGGPGGGAGPGGGPAGPVNLNTATLAQLDALPGVGPVLASRIIAYRTKHGGFRSIAELRQVDGVGDAKFEQLKDLVTV
jgi:competence protein ComEA